MLASMRRALAEGRVPSPLTVDDTYAAYFYLNSFCQAMYASRPWSTPPPLESRRNRFFPGAGLLVRENAAYYAVVSTQLAGVWQAYAGARRLTGDSGYIAVTSAGQRLSSQRRGAGTTCVVHGADAPVCTLEIETRFVTVDTSLPLVKHMVAFKLFTRWLLRIPWLALLFSRLLKKRKILAAGTGDIHLRRLFRFDLRCITVEDSLSLMRPLALRSLHRVQAGTVVHSPSSQMFSTALLHRETTEAWDAAATAQRLMHDGHLHVRTQQDVA
jgi:hypothetical protein